MLLKCRWVICLSSSLCLSGLLADSSTALKWQSAYFLQDARRVEAVANEIYQADPRPINLCYKVRARCLSGDGQGAWAIWKSIDLPPSPRYEPLQIEALTDLSWVFLRAQLQTASPEVWLFVCGQISALHEKQVCDLVLLALQHSDLRVQLAAINLVSSYPQDVYRRALMDMWNRIAHPLVRSQLLLLCANMNWPEAQVMANELSKNGQISRLEFVALAQYQMLSHHFNPDLILGMAYSADPLEQRLGAWLLRFCPLEISNLADSYKHLLGTHDEMALQIAIDTLGAFHLPLVISLQEPLRSAQTVGGQERCLQIDWLMALSDSKDPQAKIYELWKKSLERWCESASSDKEKLDASSMPAWILSEITAWLVSVGSYQPTLIGKAWQTQQSLTSSLPWSIRVQLAKGVIETRSAHEHAIVQQAADSLEAFLKQSNDLWQVDTLWLDHPALFTQPPGWMPSYMVHESAQETRWNLLELLAHVNPTSSFQMAWKLSQSLPTQWNMPMLWLAWRLKVSALPEGLKEGREFIWLKTVLLASMQDKQKLLSQWETSDPWWKERILDALLQQGDAADLPMLVRALDEAGVLRIKAACAILNALRQGYRPD